MVLKVTQFCDVDITGNVLAITKANKSKYVCEWQTKVKIKDHGHRTFPQCQINWKKLLILKYFIGVFLPIKRKLLQFFNSNKIILQILLI